MDIRFNKLEHFPKLAWCAEIRRSREWVQVLHGPWVETGSTFFCDGAWSGRFSATDFETSTLIGTAGKLTAEGLLLATSNDTVERIHIVDVGDAIFASNSLALLLAQTDDNLDPRSLFYGSKFVSIMEGLNKYVRSIPTRSGRRVQLIYHANLLIKPDLQIIKRPKGRVREFKDFADYRSFLSTTATAIAANAADPQRRVSYRPITSISSGYDSPATAVMAKEAGCTEALTFRQPRPRRVSRPEDSGEQIARLLGMEVTSLDRRDYLKEPGFTEAENIGSPQVFAAWANKLEGRLLFTGFHGGGVWDRNAMVVGPDMTRKDASGSTFTEFRLRVGFLHLPLPFVGCTSHPSIHRISNSPEMEQWSLHNKYDRPIPRRIVEEAGIPRELFGMGKNAIDVVLRVEPVETVFSRQSLEDFHRYSEDKWSFWMSVKSRAVETLRYIDQLNQGVNRKVCYALKQRFGVEVRLPRLLPTRLRTLTYGELGRKALLAHWAITTLLPRYKT